MGLAPTLFPQTTGCFSIQLRKQKWLAEPKLEANRYVGARCRPPSLCFGAAASLSLRFERRLVGSAGNAPVRHFQFCFVTPDLQSGNWITSRKLVAGVGVA